MTHPTCVIDECEKPARSGKADYCPMHYHRWYRHGDPQKSSHTSAPSLSAGRRYRTALDPTHPLAMANGKVYIHRRVLFDILGPGLTPGATGAAGP